MCDGVACQMERAIQEALDALRRLPGHYRLSEVLFAESVLRPFDRRIALNDGKVCG